MEILYVGRCTAKIKEKPNSHHYENKVFRIGKEGLRIKTWTQGGVSSLAVSADFLEET